VIRVTLCARAAALVVFAGYLPAFDASIEAMRCGNVTILEGVIPESANADALITWVESTLGGSHHKASIVLFKGASSLKGLESFGMSHLAASASLEFIEKQRRELRKHSIAWGARIGTANRIGVVVGGKTHWKGKALEVLPGIELLDARCLGTLDGSIALYLRDRGFRASEARRVYLQIASQLRIAPRQVSMYFSDDGGFFPDDMFSRQSPLLPDLVPPIERKKFRGTIRCVTDSDGPRCRFYPPI